MGKEEILIPAEKVKPLIIDGKIFRSVYDFKLTEKDLERAYLELGEIENVRRSSLEALKKKLCGTQNLHHHTDDEKLLRYLRYQKFNVDRAYTTLCNLYRLRRDYPERFSLPSNLEAILSHNIAKVLPFRTEEGCTIFWIDFRRLDSASPSVEDCAQITNVYGDIFTMNPTLQVHKYIGLWDMRGVTLRHCSKYVNPSAAMFLRKLFLDCYPMRIKQVILLHCNPIVHAAFNAIRFILKQKIADRVILLGSDISELYQYVNPKILPKEYGGDIEESECTLKDISLKNMAFMKYERSFKFIPS